MVSLLERTLVPLRKSTPFEKLVEELLGEPMKFAAMPGEYLRGPIDVIEREKEYVLRAELPGMSKEDIRVNYDEKTGAIRIDAEKHAMEEREGEHVRLASRRFGRFYESIPLPPVDAEKITATYKDGVLELVAPKTEREKTAYNIAIA
jgi:HSP20 family protein